MISPPRQFPPCCTGLLADLGIAWESLAARGLQPHAEAQCLEVAETGADGRLHQLTPAAWRALKAAALADGVALCIVSAFRSVERQAAIVRRKLDAGQDVDTILTVSAPPGFSEHHTGCAVDISTPGAPALEADFEATLAFAWLAAHAAEFCFRLSYPAGNPQGYSYEPWHWCYRPEPG
jgi:D-alanyl-D-alanine carboxypeptidase